MNKAGRQNASEGRKAIRSKAVVPPAFSRRGFLATALLSGCATFSRISHKPSLPDSFIGFSEYCTDLPTRHANMVTMRAAVVRPDGTGYRRIAEDLCDEPYAWTQFAGWSPDGTLAIIGRGWESPENAAWEEEHQTFRMTEGWLYDMYLCDIKTGALTNLTSVERVSDYNSGLFFVPGNVNSLGFTALIDGISHPFIMDRDGRNKRDISDGPEGFSYGFSASPDGKRVAYHKDYQVYVAEAEGANARLIETGNPFNFAPQWSPDGAWLMFVSGEHYDCHPHIVRPDATGLRKLAGRGGYDGVMTIIDVFDFHGGSSDVPIWSADGASIYYTAKIGDAVELMNVTLDGAITQLTQSPPGAFNYHPKQSPDGAWLAFGSNRTGTRQLYIMPYDGGAPAPITNVPPAHGAMWAHWQPPGH